MQKMEQILSTLISFDTSKKDQIEVCCDFVQSLLKEAGFEIHLLKSSSGKIRALWACRPDSSLKTTGGIILSGHLDVVPCNKKKWNTNPFELVKISDRYYGRGTCDMKGFMACVLEMAITLKDVPINRPLYISITFDEESKMKGIRKIQSVLGEFSPAWCWIGEPSCMQIIDTHFGWLGGKITVRGQSSHSSTPNKGLSAIEIASDIINYIRLLAEQKKQTPFKNSHFENPYTLFNIGTIKGGIASNVIADECSFLYEVRTHPGEDLTKIVNDIDNFIEKEINPKFENFPSTGIEHKKYEGYALEPWHGLAYRCMSELLGQNETKAVCYMTEAGFFQSSAIPTVICGPGSIEQAHKDNEFVSLEDIQHCRSLLKRLADYLKTKETIHLDEYLKKTK